MSLYQETSMSRQSHHCHECGALQVKARSPADHRRFFAMIGKAYENWNEGHEFQPSSSGHLRAWLQYQAGYNSVTTVDLSEITTSDPHLLAAARVAIEQAITAGLRDGDYVFTRARGVLVEVIRPKSIDFATLDQKAFAPIREAVEAIIEAAIGVPAERLLREQAA